MTNEEEEEKQLAEIGFGRLYDVERTAQGYVEVSSGKQIGAYETPSIDGIEVSKLNISKAVEPSTGAAFFRLTGRTTDSFRPMGAEKAFPLDVFLTSRSKLGKAVITVRLSVVKLGFYNSYGFTLHVGIAESALEQIVREIRAASRRRVLKIELATASLYHGEFLGDRGVHHGVQVLPYWTEQLPDRGKSNLKAGDELDLAWTFDVNQVSVAPEYERAISEFDRNPLDVNIRGGVVVDLEQQRDQAIKQAYDNFIDSLNRYRPYLLVIAAALVAIAVKLWLR